MFIRLPPSLELGRNKHSCSARRGRGPARRHGYRVEHHNYVHDYSAVDNLGDHLDEFDHDDATVDHLGDHIDEFDHDDATVDNLGDHLDEFDHDDATVDNLGDHLDEFDQSRPNIRTTND